MDHPSMSKRIGKLFNGSGSKEDFISNVEKEFTDKLISNAQTEIPSHFIIDLEKRRKQTIYFPPKKD